MTIHGYPRCLLRQAVRAALIAGIGGGLWQPATAGAEEQVVPSVSQPVRSHSATIVRIIDQASEQSATFRHLVEIIKAGNGIVYVEEGRCVGDIRSCLLTVTPAKPDHRILHIRIDVRKTNLDLAASIGHEFHHVTEVLRFPSVTSGAAMFLMYSRIGYPITRGFETSGAVKAGNAVRREMRAASQKHGRLP
jgi:hypothetical protein